MTPDATPTALEEAVARAWVCEYELWGVRKDVQYEVVRRDPNKDHIRVVARFASGFDAEIELPQKRNAACARAILSLPEMVKVREALEEVKLAATVGSLTIDGYKNALAQVRKISIAALQSLESKGGE
jgi:hypothetical protein